MTKPSTFTPEQDAMMTGSMVERVAAAIRETFSGESYSGRGNYEETARAAITAMREPTEAMCVASGVTDATAVSVMREIYRIRWQAMIDEALK